MTEPTSPPTHKVTSEEEIQAYSVGGVKRHDAPITVVDYDPEWPALYAREEARIRSILGDRVIEIHHTGSTSVPGLAAKPVIDITLVVPDSRRTGLVRTWRRPATASRSASRVVRAPRLQGPTRTSSSRLLAGLPEIERMVGFRDWLRTHPEDRERYERTKRDLSTRPWAYVQNYADAKIPVVDAISGRAGLPPRVD
jgi:GrpB-like predicted nucleotidyltransferase (UPF0157 family)